MEEPEEMQKTTAKSTTEEIDDVLLVHAPDRRSLPMVIDNEKAIGITESFRLC